MDVEKLVELPNDQIQDEGLEEVEIEGGSFTNGDRVRGIKSAVMGKEGQLKFIVSWVPRTNGTIPEDSLVSNEDLKNHCALKLI